MSILLIGARGQVGSAVAELGFEQNIKIGALGRLDLDITDSEAVFEAVNFHKPRVLINAAAYTDVERAEENPEVAHSINDLAISNLADVCSELNVPLLHLSTDYVFDGNKRGQYTESDFVNPLGAYARSKEAGERRLRACLQEHVILRVSSVFGAEGNNFVKTIVRLAKEQGKLEVVDDQIAGPTSSFEIAKVLLKIAERVLRGDFKDWGTYHYCQKPYVSWYEFAIVIVNRAYKIGLIDRLVQVDPIPSSKFPTKAARPQNSKLSSEKIEKVFAIDQNDWFACLDRVLLSVK